MESYQRKRLQPLAFLVIGLVLMPLGIVPVTQMMQPALSNLREAEAKSTKTAHLSPDITAHPTTTTTPVPATAATGTLEGMTLDAPIRRPGLLTESLA
ncbi:hypothetical protein ACFH1Q_21775 [Raoultella ornithinolytica]|uniref:hypothetical protein n=1 Tax=Raoultella ornithinolytica TaxID=54291 RepID=UPI003611750E